MWKHLPNAITLSRLFIAALLFALLSIELSSIRTGFLGNDTVVLTIAAIVFILCVATDALDGWVARKYELVSAFGRIADPFVDKIVVLGSFVYLVEITENEGLVESWFVTLLVAREFLVTSLRSHLESQGIPFGARAGGKIKMVVQSFTVPIVLLYQGYFTEGMVYAGTTGADVALWVTVAFMALTLLTTWMSAWEYIAVAVRELRKSKPPEDTA